MDRIIWSVLFCAVLFAVTTATDAAMIHRWSFDDPDGLTAPQVTDSIGTNHGTFQPNGVMTDANRSTDVPAALGSGRSLDFDDTQNNRVALSTQVVLAPNADWTVALWYRGTETGTAITPGVFGGSTLLGRDANDIFANLVISQSKVVYAHYMGGWQDNIKSTTSVDDNVWHHIALVHHNNATADLYIDGVLEGSGASGISLTQYPYRIDYMMRGWNTSFTDGKLDDVYVFNHALSQLEVQNLIPEPGAVAALAAGLMATIKRRRRPALQGGSST